MGYKALAVNVSDIAAMGGTPRLALLSLDPSRAADAGRFDGCSTASPGNGLEAVVALAGGNIARSPGPLVVDVTAVGEVRPRRVLTRGGGRPETCSMSPARSGRRGRPRMAAGGGTRAIGIDCESRADGDGIAAGAQAPNRRDLGRTRTATACMDLSDGLADAVSAIASGQRHRRDHRRRTRSPSPPRRRWFGARGRIP